ncbi:MAG: hypothetical protein GX675_04790 [Erysipelotrichaceae bacterium]|nr:hypothetical protein [Erysipelotrichaceae bacterium]
MKNLFEKYKSLPINSQLICLEQRNAIEPHFCYPSNAEPIGFEGSIMYCFIEGYKDMVFASNPESCADHYVYPLAANFKDFMRLILFCGTANPIEQIIWMDKKQFDQHLLEEKEIQTEQQKELLHSLGHELNIVPMEEPFEYVKNIQFNFDDSNIKYSDEYYNVLGITR